MGCAGGYAFGAARIFDGRRKMISPVREPLSCRDAGAALAIAAERAFLGTNAPPWKPALRLATVYTHLRNPMYAGGLTLLAGAGICACVGLDACDACSRRARPALWRRQARGAISRRKVRRGLSCLQGPRAALWMALVIAARRPRSR